MRVLAIESSTAFIAVAAGDDAGLAQRCERAGSAHSERALPLVAEVLAERGWTLADVDGIAFGAGPGSFTGVRIACGIAQGLALGADKPVIAIGTLTVLAEEARMRHGATRVFACVDARMHEIYVAASIYAEDEWVPSVGPAVLKPDDVVVPSGRWWGVGDGFTVAPRLAAHASFDGVDAALLPSASALVALARTRLARGEGVAPAAALPLYVRHRVALTTAERAAGARL